MSSTSIVASISMRLRWLPPSPVLPGSSRDLVAHAVGSTSSEVLDLPNCQGVTALGVDHFDARSPHPNGMSRALAESRRRDRRFGRPVR